MKHPEIKYKSQDLNYGITCLHSVPNILVPFNKQ